MIIQGVTLNNVGFVVDTAPSPAYVTSGLQLYYNPLTSYAGSGTSVTDLSGNGFTGTLVNSPTWNSAGYFTYNGSNTYLQTPDMVNKFNSTSSQTIEMWIYASAAGVALTENGQTGTPNSGWTYSQIYFGPTFGSIPVIWTNTWTGTITAGAAGFATPAYNTWKHVVLTYNGTNMISYQNTVAGSAVAATRQTPWNSGAPGSRGYVLSIGAASSTINSGGTVSATNFNGRIGLVRAYNRALSSAEVTQNYNANKATYGL